MSLSRRFWIYVRSVVYLLLAIPLALYVVNVRGIALLFPIEVWPAVAFAPALYVYVLNLLKTTEYSLEGVQTVLETADDADKKRLEIAVTHAPVGWAVIRYLRRVGKASSACMQTDFAKKFRKDPETIRLRLKMMLADHLVNTMPSLEDRRLILYEITQDGLDVAEVIDTYFPQRLNTVVLTQFVSWLSAQAQRLRGP